MQNTPRHTETHKIHPDIRNIHPDIRNIHPDIHNIQTDIQTSMMDIHCPGTIGMDGNLTCSSIQLDLGRC